MEDKTKTPQDYILMVKKKKKNNAHYVDKVKLQEAMVDYIGKMNAAKDLPPDQKPKISNYIGKCIWDIAEHLGQMPKFNNYSYLDEMKEDGIENVIRYINNYDPVRFNNPFQYFSVIINFAFIRRIAKEKKHQYIKYKMTANHGMFDDIIMNNSDGKEVPFEYYDNIAEYIEIYEGKKAAKAANVVKTKPEKKGLEKLMEDE